MRHHKSLKTLREGNLLKKNKSHRFKKTIRSNILISFRRSFHRSSAIQMTLTHFLGIHSSPPPNSVLGNLFSFVSSSPVRLPSYVTWVHKLNLHFFKFYFALPFFFDLEFHFEVILVVFSLFFLKVWQIHFQFLRFMVVASSSVPVLVHSSSLVMTFGQKMPSI